MSGSGRAASTAVASSRMSLSYDACTTPEDASAAGISPAGMMAAGMTSVSCGSITAAVESVAARKGSLTQPQTAVRTTRAQAAANRWWQQLQGKRKVVGAAALSRKSGARLEAGIHPSFGTRAAAAQGSPQSGGTANPGRRRKAGALRERCDLGGFRLTGRRWRASSRTPALQAASRLWTERSAFLGVATDN